MLSSFVIAYLLAGSHQDAPRFDFFGTMDSVLVAGARVAPVSRGMAFRVVLSEGGTKIAGGAFDLTPSGASQGFSLNLPDLAFADGHLKGQAEIKNGSGTSLQGVRLDVVGATETYRAKDAAGKEVEKTRAVTVSLPSPLMFGDLGEGASNGQLPFDVSSIVFKPETISIAVNGIVSGERFVKAIDLPTVRQGGQMDVDAKGRFYFSDVTNNCVTRTDNDGSNPIQLCKMPDQAKGMAVNPKTGVIAANCGNFATMFFFDADGNQTLKLADGVLENYAGTQRYDANGRLWSSISSTYWGFDASNKPNLKIDKLGDFDTTGEPFDVAPGGTFYAIVGDSVYVRHPDGKGGVFAKGVGDKLGQLFGPTSIRIAPDGQVFVAQSGANNSPVSGVTVFDPAGRVVRAFGRGAKQAKEKFPDEYWPSQLFRPSDIAFGRDGTIYIASSNPGLDGVRVLVFAPF